MSEKAILTVELIDDTGIRVQMDKEVSFPVIGHAIRMASIELDNLIMMQKMKQADEGIIKQPNAVPGSFIQNIRNKVK